MPTVKVSAPQRSGSETIRDVTSGADAFSVMFRRVDPNDPVLNEHPGVGWEAHVRLPDGTTFGQYGMTRKDAFGKAHAAASAGRALRGVDWHVVTKALSDVGAFA